MLYNVAHRIMLTAAFLMLSTAALAQTLDKRVIFGFSGPVTLPGVTLPAGQYLFRVADAMTGRNVIQVLSADGTKIYGTFFAIPAYRTVVPEKPEVRFMETRSTLPHAIRTWWYPADSTGFELIYPKDQARLLASGVGESVLTTRAATTTAAETKTDELSRISPAGQETAVDLKAAPSPSAPSGTSESGEVASPSLVIPSNPVPVEVED